jgi:excisionase family DNA binding protein
VVHSAAFQALGREARDIWAGTLHGFGAWLLRREASAVARMPAFTILDGADTRRLVEQLCRHLTHVSRSHAVLDELVALLSQASTEELPNLLGHFERLAATLPLVAGVSATPLPPPPVDPAALLTVAEVALRLKITPWSVYDLIRRDRLPGVRLGRALRARQVDLETYVHERVADGAYTMYVSEDDGSNASAAAAGPSG